MRPEERYRRARFGLAVSLVLVVASGWVLVESFNPRARDGVLLAFSIVLAVAGTVLLVTAIRQRRRR